ncbi:hypothetical protein N0V88_000761 [Collariella sp. IMI 366227]|nr:hypothetical protein N0V88_000761 [Collariella sp. IMI 366227]
MADQHDNKSTKSTPTEKNNVQVAAQDDGSELEGGLFEDSPYEEVRAIVPPVDDPTLPVSTFRAWFLGIVSTAIFAGILQFFQLHSPPVFLSAYVVIIVTLPAGHFMARVLPTREFNLFGFSFTLNPGPFNHKEHTIIAIMASLVSAFDNGSLASDVYVAFDKFLGIPIAPGYRLMFLLTTQGLSFGFVGLFHRFLVRPAFCIWPGALPTCSMIYGFHDPGFKNTVANGWKMHRMKFFWVAVLIAGSWQVVPSSGLVSGMDLLPLTLDWNQISGYLYSPLVVPSWAILNVLCGSIFFLWIVSPALHWTNVWYGRYFPFSSSKTFDNTGASYNTSRVMNDDYSLNNEAYGEYSPVFLSTTSVLSYGLGFASITSILIHTFLHHRQTLWTAIKTAARGTDDETEDVHGKLMHAYKQVPEWWYAIFFAILMGISMAFLYVYKTQLPWWGLIVSVLLNIVLLVPIGIMAATCNITVNTGVLSALIAGFIWPGNMMNNVVFKVFTLVCTFQGLGYVQSMKTGQYMKIPPRVTFTAQILSIVISWLAQTGVNLWAMANVEGICTPSAVNNFFCPLAQGYAANAVFWGLIGPSKLFQSGSMYNDMLWFFLIGAALPVILYFLSKKFPDNKFLSKIHAPVIFASTSAIPPATAANYVSWGAVGLLFNMFVKQRYKAWWSKYNYLLSAALDSGLAIATFLVFFCLTYPGVSLDWWGNNIAYMTADGQGTPLDTVAPGETFGPKKNRIICEGYVSRLVFRDQTEAIEQRIRGPSAKRRCTLPPPEELSLLGDNSAPKAFSEEKNGLAREDVVPVRSSEEAGVTGGISSRPEDESVSRDQADDLFDDPSSGIDSPVSQNGVLADSQMMIQLEEDHPLWRCFRFPQDMDYFQRLVEDEVRGFSSILPFWQLIDEEPTTAPHVWSAALAISALTLRRRKAHDTTTTRGGAHSPGEHALWHYANAIRLLGQEFPHASPQAFSGLPASDLRGWLLTRLLLANFDLYRGAIGSWRAHLSDAGRVFSVCHHRIVSSESPASPVSDLRPEFSKIFRSSGGTLALVPGDHIDRDCGAGEGRRLVHAFARMALLLEMHNAEFSISRLRGVNPGVAHELSTMVSRSESPRDRLLALIRDIGKVEIKLRSRPAAGEQCRPAGEMEQLDARLALWQRALAPTELPVDTGVEAPVRLGSGAGAGGDELLLAVMPLTFPSAADPYVAAVNYAHFLCARMRARTRYGHGAERIAPPDTEATALHICRIAAGLSPKGYAEADAFGHGMMPAVVGAYRWTVDRRLRAWIEGWLEGYELEGCDREGIWSVRKTMRLQRFLSLEESRRRNQTGLWNIIAATIDEDDDLDVNAGTSSASLEAGVDGVLITGTGTNSGMGIDPGVLERADCSRAARVLDPFKVIVHSRTASGWATDHYIVA